MSKNISLKRLSPIKPGDPIDYKDVDLLKKFITERGKILPRRRMGLTAKQQRDLTNAVKRARIVAMLPFVNPRADPWLTRFIPAILSACLKRVTSATVIESINGGKIRLRVGFHGKQQLTSKRHLELITPLADETPPQKLGVFPG